MTWFMKTGLLGICPPPGNAEHVEPDGGWTVTEVSPGGTLGKITAPMPPVGMVSPYDAPMEPNTHGLSCIEPMDAVAPTAGVRSS